MQRQLANQTRTYLPITCMLVAEKRLLNAFSVLTEPSPVSACCVCHRRRTLCLRPSFSETSWSSDRQVYPALLGAVPCRGEVNASHLARPPPSFTLAGLRPAVCTGCECVNQISRVKPSSSAQMQMQHAGPD